MRKEQERKNRPLNAWMIALINVAAICNIKNFPLLAEYGLSVVLFLALSAFFFFIPVSLVSSELASGWADRGVYTWVTEALGPRAGFLAVWLQWSSNVIWYPTILSFIAVTLSYTFNPALATDNTYVMSAIVIAFWSATFLNFLGMRVSGWVSSITALFGTIIPIALIIFFGAKWLILGRPSQISFHWKELLPNLGSLNELVLLSGVLLGLAGMEMSAVHARDVRDPHRDYPKAIFLSASLILLFSTLGALAIAILLPASQIQLAGGGMEAFQLLFHSFGLSWGVPCIAGIMAFGALGMMSTWIAGPSRGLLATAQHGDLPSFFQKTNRQGMPINILLVQALLVTALSFVFLFMPSVNSSYWALVALASILYQIMYVLMFISAIVLRYKRPEVQRAYRISRSNGGMWAVALLGICGSLFGFFFGFLPPTQFDTGNVLPFEAFLIGSALFFCLLPLLFAKNSSH